MAYRRISEKTDTDNVYFYKIRDYQVKLKQLDDDFKILEECKPLLAQCSVYFKDLLKECDDIKKTFDRSTIESKYDSYQITFNGKDLIFDYLDNIVSATDKFKEICDEIKTKIDDNYNLDNECIEISNEAKKISNIIVNLNKEYYNTMNRIDEGEPNCIDPSELDI